MSLITLIRHGQANTTARNEVDYDRLSPLGKQQAQWLGAHLRTSSSDGGHIRGRVYCGTLTRHQETAQAMGLGVQLVCDPRLNELEYFTLAQLMEQQHGVAIPADREEFITHLPRVFLAWQRGEIAHPPESFEQFETRVREAMTEIAAGAGPATVVTSGGLIAMAMRQVLGLDIASMARMALAIMNTSVHRLFPIGDTLSPVLFNAVPHLEAPERHYAQTHL
ncbi:MAG: histidine phosphatase family protein [Pseudodonghicola sp.]|nr:histidine phosphatase family protein [Pseudodonghicola sp.]